MSYMTWAGSLDINLSDDSVRVNYSAPFHSAEYDVGFLYNEDDDWVANLGLLAHGIQESSTSRLKASFGGKVYYADFNDEEALALGLGGRISYFPNNLPVGFGGYIFYATDVVTGLDAERFYDAGVHVEWEIMQTTSIYFGYRKVEMRLEKNGKDVKIDDGGHVGLKINF
jgi:hypothetical protein